MRNLLRNRDYRQYYLDCLEFLLDTQFNPEAFSQQIATGSGDGLWGRVRQAAYLESATPYGQPFTGRQFTNDEVYLSGCQQNELRHGAGKGRGHHPLRPHAARQRAPAAGRSCGRITPARHRPDSDFPATMEPLP